MIENPEKCPICRAHWDFEMTPLGQVVAVHPITPCLAPAALFEKEDEEESKKSRLWKCVECEQMFRRKRHSNAVICGSKCRKVRRDRKFAESMERVKKRYFMGRAA